MNVVFLYVLAVKLMRVVKDTIIYEFMFVNNYVI